MISEKIPYQCTVCGVVAPSVGSNGKCVTKKACADRASALDVADESREIALARRKLAREIRKRISELLERTQFGTPERVVAVEALFCVDDAIRTTKHQNRRKGFGTRKHA